VVVVLEQLVQVAQRDVVRGRDGGWRQVWLAEPFFDGGKDPVEQGLPQIRAAAVPSRVVARHDAVDGSGPVGEPGRQRRGDQFEKCGRQSRGDGRIT
jgi:hypothetical protein